jgi:hypothetical protein
MELVIWHKFSQHRDLKDELLATGEAELIEVCYCHPFFHVFREIQIEIRTPLRMCSGVVVPMERAGMNWVRHS